MMYLQLDEDTTVSAGENTTVFQCGCNFVTVLHTDLPELIEFLQSAVATVGPGQPLTDEQHAARARRGVELAAQLLIRNGWTVTPPALTPAEK